MKKTLILFALMGIVSSAHSAETIGEKAKATSNDAGRAINKGANRVKETVCAESDAKCLEEKAKHRAHEGAEYTKDKASEIKNEIDNDEK